jgi:hypothetical protein
MGLTNLADYVLKRFLTNVLYSKLGERREEAPEPVVDAPKVEATKRAYVLPIGHGASPSG